jgi:hypothetical protein
MSLEKEPAGAFNKAQRLIELSQYTSSSRFLQGRNPFCFSQAVVVPARKASKGSCRREGGLYRLTRLRESGHVNATKPHLRDKRVGLSKVGEECRRYSPSKSQ